MEYCAIFISVLVIIVIGMYASNRGLKQEIENKKKKIQEYEDKNKGIEKKEQESLLKVKNFEKQEQERIEANERESLLKIKEYEKQERDRLELEKIKSRNQIDNYKAQKNIECKKEYDKIQKLQENWAIKNLQQDEKEKELSEKEEKLKILHSNLTAIPYMSAIIADFDTRGIAILADKLDWGSNVERSKKVASIRDIRKNAQELIEQYQEAYYQLEYLKQMFPSVSDFIDTEYEQVKKIDFNQIADTDHDKVRDYMTKEEYNSLNESDRNQLALDRYVQSHHKSNWQIGRDYELYVGYQYSKMGYSVEYFGENNGLNDLGRDIIAKNDSKTLVIQCKYWSATKEIHENHINQLYGTTICYCLEHNIPVTSVRPVLVTNIKLSETAKKFADYLHVLVSEGYPMREYPRIKCNINRDSYGIKTYIYHLPFDQQYDSCKIDAPGEFFAMTVKEAEAAGFRRAFKWHGESD